MYNTLAALCIRNVGDDALALLGKQHSMTGKLIEVMRAGFHAAKWPKFCGKTLTRQKTEQHKSEVAGHISHRLVCVPGHCIVYPMIRSTIIDPHE